MLLNTCKPIESTNNFYMWRAIFDKLICEDMLERLEKRRVVVVVSTWRVVVVVYTWQVVVLSSTS